MSADAGSGPGRYWAFISYSHKDAAFGRRLHRRLEGYVLPRRLVGRADGKAMPRRLAPIFRDREEFSAAQDLSAEVRAALAQSRSLVVVCSPAAAASTWVTREVELFRALHPGRPILAAIRDGEPAESLPAALRQTNAAGELVEPLAADFRKGGDGWAHGVLKLVAGIVGVGLDELVQRDSQWRMRRVTAVTAGALALVLVMGVLTVFALNARSEAERQRGEAEGLVEFMLTDLRTTLKGVGRLDAMTAVNARALKYYADEDLSRLPPESLERRARILHAMGEDDETGGDHAAALRNFEEARRTTATLMAAAPDDPERIFTHAQSEFWIGFYDYMRHQYRDARPHFLSYEHLAERMVSLAPKNPRYLRELSYAEGDLCTLALSKPEDPPAAVRLCGKALAHMKEAAREEPGLDHVAVDISDKESWMGSAFHAVGDNGRALQHWQIQERMLEGFMAADPQNAERRGEWVALQRNMARMDAGAGRRDLAEARLRSAAARLDAMTRLDPSNAAWTLQKRKIEDDLRKLGAH